MATTDKKKKARLGTLSDLDVSMTRDELRTALDELRTALDGANADAAYYRDQYVKIKGDVSELRGRLEAARAEREHWRDQAAGKDAELTALRAEHLDAIGCLDCECERADEAVARAERAEQRVRELELAAALDRGEADRMRQERDHLRDEAVRRRERGDRLEQALVQSAEVLAWMIANDSAA